MSNPVPPPPLVESLNSVFPFNSFMGLHALCHKYLILYCKIPRLTSLHQNYMVIYFMNLYIVYFIILTHFMVNFIMNRAYTVIIVAKN